jgi:hypothetical protein
MRWKTQARNLPAIFSVLMPCSKQPEAMPKACSPASTGWRHRMDETLGNRFFPRQINDLFHGVVQAQPDRPGD